MNLLKGVLKVEFPTVATLALTATVTELVKRDIIKNLKIENCLYFQSSFHRPNLYYEVSHKCLFIKFTI